MLTKLINMFAVVFLIGFSPLASGSSSDTVEYFPSFYLSYSFFPYSVVDSALSVLKVSKAEEQWFAKALKADIGFKPLPKIHNRGTRTVFVHKGGTVEIEFDRIEARELFFNGKKLVLGQFGGVRGASLFVKQAIGKEPFYKDYALFYTYILVGLNRFVIDLLSENTVDHWLHVMYDGDAYRTKYSIDKRGWVRKFSNLRLQCEGDKVQEIAREHYSLKRKKAVVFKAMYANPDVEGYIWRSAISGCSTFVSPRGLIIRSEESCPIKGTSVFQMRPFYTFMKFAEACCGRPNCSAKISQHLDRLRLGI